MSKTDLQEVLDEFGAEGQWDSQGSFTTLSGKALSKLAAYQLPRPTAWILKLVQAAVAAACLRVRFDPNPNLTDLVVTFVGGELGTLEQLADIWTSPTATVTLAQKHLLVGLRAAVVSPLVRRATEQMLSDRSMIPEAVKLLFGNEAFGFWSVMAMAVVLSATLAPAISYFGFGIGAVGALGFHSLFRKNRKSDLRETQAALQQWCERQHTHHFAAEQTRSSEQ